MCVKNNFFTGCRKVLASLCFSAQQVFFRFPKCHQTIHRTVFSLLHLTAPEPLWSGAGLRAASGVGITRLKRIRSTTAALRVRDSLVQDTKLLQLQSDHGKVLVVHSEYAITISSELIVMAYSECTTSTLPWFDCNCNGFIFFKGLQNHVQKG